MKTLIRSGLLVLAIPLVLTACGSNQADTNNESSGTTVDSSLSDTSVMDTSINTATSTDTLQNPLKEGVDGTGRPNTDATHKKE
jgi:ABC-type glycerol-3-phosphate transport system substrate-binding protein